MKALHIAEFVIGYPSDAWHTITFMEDLQLGLEKGLLGNYDRNGLILTNKTSWAYGTSEISQIF